METDPLLLENWQRKYEKVCGLMGLTMGRNCEGFDEVSGTSCECHLAEVTKAMRPLTCQQELGNKPNRVN